LPILLFAQESFYPDTAFVLPEVDINAQQAIIYAGTRTSTIDSLVLSNKKTHSLSELISENTPVFIKTYGRGSMATASFRGTSSSHTEIVWNNIPVNSPMLGMADFSLIPVYITDNIRLEHGLAGVWQGTGALGGRIILENKPNWQKGLGVDLISSFGSYNTWEQGLGISYERDKLALNTNIYLNKSDNNFTFENNDIINGNIQTRKNAEYLNYGILQQVYYRPNLNNVISAKVWLQKSERSIPMLTTNESGAGNNFNRQSDNSMRASIEWDRSKNYSRYSLISSLSIQNTEYQLQNYINGLGYFSVINSLGEVLSMYNTFNAQWTIKEYFIVKSGVKLNWHNVNSYESVYQTGYNKSRLETVFSAAGFYQKNGLRSGFIINQEFYDSVFAPLVPVLQAEYSFASNFLLRANIGRNFHKPSLNDLYYQPGGNTNLLPEKGYSAELGGEYKWNKANCKIVIDASAFVNDIKNWIMWQPTLRGYWTPLNLDEVLAYGGEVSLKSIFKFNSTQLQVKVNYSYTRSKNKNQNSELNLSQLPYIPIHSANVFASLIYKTYSLTWQWNYFSERYTTTGSDNYSLFLLYPYYMNDVYISKHFYAGKNKFNVQLGVFNVFNEKYSSVLWQPMPGINFRIKLRYTFGS
jgi:outer membrane cobalamin receptor